MEYNNFHFTEIFWLFGLVAIPAIVVLYALFFRKSANTSRLEGFIDAHLLPHLLINQNTGEQKIWKTIAIWSLLWALLMGALAGPRWDYKEIETSAPDQSLVVLLDLSQSMDAEDVKPSRLARARQEIEDILQLSKGVKIALVAFAADPHMITPLTDDVETIRHLLPSLDTDLVYVQGSNFAPALDMALNLLSAEPGNNKSVLVISDGGFSDIGASIATAGKLSKQGIILHTMGMGTKEGVPIHNAKGAIIKQNGRAVISRLEQDKLQEVSNAGAGRYITANYSENDSLIVLNQLKARAQAENNKQHKTRHWEERFYLLIIPLMAILLFWFRKGFVFPVVILLLFCNVPKAQAAEFHDYFKNSQQIGKEALEKGEYDKAVSKLKDPYQQGVAQYKAGNFAEAERLFSESERKNIQDSATYNLGNSLAQQEKFGEAISEYEKLLAHNPNHQKAKHNLNLVKKLLEQQKRRQKDGENNKEDSKQNSDENSKEQKGDSSEKNKSGDKDQNGSKGEDKQDNKQSSNEEQKEAQKKSESNATPESETAFPDGDSKETQDAKPAKTQQDIDADQWLNRATNDPKSFLKNQFYIESKRNKTKEGSKPW